MCNAFSRCTELPGKPGVPEYVSIMDGKIDLKWTAPEEDGGAAITNYVLEYREEGQLKWIRANKKDNPNCQFLVKGLKKEGIYEFRVAAENKVGVGRYSDSTTPVKPEEKIGTHDRCEGIVLVFS